MKWLLAGLAFAAFVAIAIVTATVRADNAIRRHEAECRYIEAHDLDVELQRLEAQLLDRESARRLARAHSRYLESEFLRRRGLRE